MKAETAIIIINWNGIQDTIACIESLQNIDYKGFHIFLIDNNSNNKEYLRLSEKYKDFENITILKNESNLGFGAAHNNLIFQRDIPDSIKYYCLLNNDTVVKKTFLKKALTTIENKEVDLVALMMMDYDNHQAIDSAGLTMLTNGEIIPNQSAARNDDSSTIIAPSGGAFLVTKTCFESLKGFDPHFFVGYEDAEFGLRAFLNGYKIVLDKEPTVYHKGGQSIKKIFNRDYANTSIRNYLYSYYKLMPMEIILLFLPFRTIRYIILIIACLLTFNWRLAFNLIKAQFNFIRNDLFKSLSKRIEVKKSNKSLSWLDVFKVQRSTIAYDIKRFKRVLFKKDGSSMDTYRPQS